MSLTYEQLRLQLADTLEPFVDDPLPWLNKHGAKLRELAKANGARVLLGAVRAAAKAGVRKLDFFDQDAARWVQQARQEQRQAPPPARPAVVCKACGGEVRPAIGWCQACGCPLDATPEEVDEHRHGWELERRDPAAALAERERVLEGFRATLPWRKTASLADSKGRTG